MLITVLQCACALIAMLSIFWLFKTRLKDSSNRAMYISIGLGLLFALPLSFCQPYQVKVNTLQNFSQIEMTSTPDIETESVTLLSNSHPVTINNVFIHKSGNSNKPVHYKLITYKKLYNVYGLNFVAKKNHILFINHY